MSLEKESLTHKIEDDLALRNRNWDKLDSHLADYATITSMEFPFSAGVKANTARITKIGKVVNLTIGVKKSDGSVFAQGYPLIIGQLPVGYRPAHPIIVPAGLGDSEWRIQDVAYVYIATNGEISVTNQVNDTGKVIYFSTTYIVD